MSAAPRASGDHRRRQPCWLPARTRRRRPAFRTVPAWSLILPNTFAVVRLKGLPHPMHHPDTHILLQPWVLLVPGSRYPETLPHGRPRAQALWGFILGRFPRMRTLNRSSRATYPESELRKILFEILGYPDCERNFTKFGGLLRNARELLNCAQIFTCDARAY